VVFPKYGNMFTKFYVPQLFDFQTLGNFSAMCGVQKLVLGLLDAENKL